MISLDNLKTTLNAIKCLLNDIKYLLNDYAKKKDIPTKLPNPNSLTFTGAEAGKYDGSKPLMVEIPSIVQTDYNQNDSTAPDYMKNRPFYTGDTGIVKIDKKYLPFLPKPNGEAYLTFSSSNGFTLSIKFKRKIWDGTLEYFASDGTWTVWNGDNTLSAESNGGEYVLYLRGTGNTIITANSDSIWQLDGSDISCIGNIETLLDYATVESGQHPTMGNNCYSRMFSGCTSLTKAPELHATTLADSCYSSMFSGCTSLTQAPKLPATTLADNCYFSMFYSCTSLAQAPELPATTLKSACYKAMFRGCTSLKLSKIRTGEYTQEYRIPSSGHGTTAKDALVYMFDSTGGTFKGTPEINKTYYLSSDNMIARGNEIATLNGYVKTMIDSIDIPSGGGSVPTNVSAFTNDAGYLTLDTLPKYEGVVE